VRQTLDDAGVPRSASGLSFSPFGVPQSGATPEPFGFTGELHHEGLVYLRARWYDAGEGTFTSRDAFEGWSPHPATLHPYQYVGNDPITLTDPSGRCYPPLGWLRDVEPTNCGNLDEAISISQHPNASAQERALANSYIVAFTGSHAALLVGAGILTWKAVAVGSAAATSISQWGTAYVGSHVAAGTVAGKAALGIGAVGLALNYVDEATVSVLAAMGDCNAVGEWTALQQLGAADGPVIPAHEQQ
jgi:RHS repeat-associated protein